MKATPHHVRLDPDVEEEIKKIAEATNLTQLEIIRQMVRAGTKAIKANGYKLQLPLSLAVIEQPKNSSSSTSGLGGGAGRKKSGDAPGGVGQQKVAS